MRSRITFASLVAAVVCASLAWADAPGVVQGTVKSAAGQPVSGAYVKLFNADKGLTLMVVSQDKGRYTARNLPAGNYSVQAIGGEMQSKASQVNVNGSKPASADLSLTEQRAAELAPGWPGTPGTVGGAETWNKMPPPTLPDGPGKEIAQTMCNQCHGYRWFMDFRGNREEWGALINSMRSNIAAMPERAKDLTPEQIATLTDYFAKNFATKPLPDPNSRLPRTLLSGKAAHYVAVDFKIPTIESEPHEMSVAEGVQWVGERGAGKLARFDTDYNFKEFIPPMGKSPRNRLGAVVTGIDGKTIWTVDGGPNHRWLEFDIATQTFKSFPVPANIKGYGNGNTIRQHPNGTVWVASGGANGMVGLDPKTGKWFVYQSPAGIKKGSSVGPYGFAIDGAGKIWFAEYANNGVGRLDPLTGEIEDFQVPIPNAVPRKVTSDKDGNIWVALHESGQILKIDYKTTKMEAFPPPSQHPGTYSPSADLKNGYIWVSLQGVDKIARYDPKSNSWMEFALPSAETDVRRIEVDQDHPNRVWWSGTLSNRIGYIEVLNN